MRLRSTLLALSLAAPLSAAAAQDSPASTGSTPPRHYVNSLGINPLGLPFGLFSAEFEHALRGGVSLGLGGSYVPSGVTDDDTRDGWIEGKLLYYPNENPLKGFSVGLTAGYEAAHGPPSALFADNSIRRSDSGPTLGVVLDYNWLLGRRKRFLVGIGGGAKRVLKQVDGNSSPLMQVYPSGRLTLGLAY